jgi:hypothetical protein
MADLKKQECKACGATLNFDPKSVSQNCSFCGSQYFVELPETEEDKQMKNDAEIILFKVEKDAAKETFANWIKKGLFKPSDLTSAFKEKDFDGVYVPAFKVSADASTEWSGNDKILINEASDGEPAEYEHEYREGNHSDSYKDFIAATKGLEQNEFDNIQPYDDNDTKGYTQELMMGFKVEMPAITEGNAINTSKDRMKEWEKDACRSKCDELKDSSTTISNVVSKLMMLPIWILVYTYNDKPYRVLINGQSGKISGEKPTSKIKVIIALVLVGLIGVGIYFGIQAAR